MKRNHVKLLFVLITLAVAVVACTGTRGESHKRRDDLSDETGTDTYTFEVGEAVEKIDLRMQVNATSGSILWKLVNPQGTLAWDGVVTAGEEFDDTRDFDPVTGDWEL